MASIEKRIMGRVRAKGRWRWVCSSVDFLDFGSRASVRRALARLAERGDLHRVEPGLYYLPYFSRILNRWGGLRMEKAIEALARRDGIRIMREGGDCANGLGLTNGVAAKFIYDTDGSTRVVKISRTPIYFRHADPKVMFWAGKRSAPVAQALRWLGQYSGRNPKVVRKLRRILPDHVKEELARYSDYLPDWGAEVARQLVEPLKEAA